MPPEPWTTSASASLASADGVVTLVEGSAFCISNRAGEIDPDHPQGLIFRDTRFLSEFRLRLNGNVPEPLAGNRHVRFGGSVSFGWLSDDFGPGGAIGDPTDSSAELGKHLFEASVSGLLEAMHEIDTFDFGR